MNKYAVVISVKLFHIIHTVSMKIAIMLHKAYVTYILTYLYTYLLNYLHSLLGLC